MSNQTSQTLRKLHINLSLLWASCSLGILNILSNNHIGNVAYLVKIERRKLCMFPVNMILKDYTFERLNNQLEPSITGTQACLSVLLCYLCCHLASGKKLIAVLTSKMQITTKQHIKLIIIYRKCIPTCTIYYFTIIINLRMLTKLTEISSKM